MFLFSKVLFLNSKEPFKINEWEVFQHEEWFMLWNIICFMKLLSLFFFGPCSDTWLSSEKLSAPRLSNQASASLPSPDSQKVLF